MVETATETQIQLTANSSQLSDVRVLYSSACQNLIVYRISASKVITQGRTDRNSNQSLESGSYRIGAHHRMERSKVKTQTNANPAAIDRGSRIRHRPSPLRVRGPLPHKKTTWAAVSAKRQTMALSPRNNRGPYTGGSAVPKNRRTRSTTLWGSDWRIAATSRSTKP